MKATGIVRRIDNLGRVVIPKEIRRTMRFNEGDMLEIFTNNDEVIFKKYSVIESMSTVAKDILGAMYLTHKMPIIVCDMEKVIVAKGINKDEIVNRRITADLEGILERRKVFAHDESTGEFCFPVEGVEHYAIACAPVIASGDTVGAILFLSVDKTPTHSALDKQIDLVKAFAIYLGEQIAN